jgi:hypothetical protein
MATVWHGVVNAERGGELCEWRYDDQAVNLQQGAEMGRFLLGSTVVMLFPEGPLNFNPAWAPGRAIRMGEVMGRRAESPALMRERAEGDTLDGSANVTRPSGSFFISLRHPTHHPRQAASVVCVFEIPALHPRSGWWGAQRSGIKEETEGRGTAAELSATAA